MEHSDFTDFHFSSLAEMDTHSREIHGRIPKKTPKIVKMRGPVAAPKENRPFVDHMKVRKSEPTKKCKICLSKFYTTDEVKAHVDIVHEFDDQRCEICGIVCTGKVKLQEHMDLHATRYDGI